MQEHMGMHHRHEMEHDMHEEGEKAPMHKRHQMEMKEMHVVTWTR